MKVAVAGGLARHPLGSGGYAWAFLQFALGLRELGAEVRYVEHLAARDCVDAAWRPAPFAESANAAAFRAVMARHRLDGSLLLGEGEEAIGADRAALRDWTAGADLFVNLSGRWHWRDVMMGARRRVYVDLDPGFTQIWQAGYGVDMNLAGHDTYVTVGLNVGRADCPVPTLGLRWHPLPPPVVRALWQPIAAQRPVYTTVADWRGYGPIEWQGIRFGQKADELRRIIDLPRRVAVPLELCLAIHPDEPDLPALRAHGWRLSDPRREAADDEAYRRYVRGSRGEFSVAKQGYVAGRTGWLSDRTACYLAAGRPAVVQDTGIAGHLPVGSGLLTFVDGEGAAAALAAVERDHERHAAAAQALAAEYFDARVVLRRLLELAL
ncbi:hypothetical protein KF840_06050 [bacterium]|nr:hypothetical protein [bacterium]